MILRVGQHPITSAVDSIRIDVLVLFICARFEYLMADYSGIVCPASCFLVLPRRDVLQSSGIARLSSLEIDFEISNV